MINPLFPCSIISDIPLKFETTGTHPNTAASATTLGNPSVFETKSKYDFVNKS